MQSTLGFFVFNGSLSSVNHFVSFRALICSEFVVI